MAESKHLTQENIMQTNLIHEALLQADLSQAGGLKKKDGSTSQHRAFYHAVSKQRWMVYQKREYLYWLQQKDELSLRQNFVQHMYVPLLQKHLSTLAVAADKLQILEFGCGPVCTAQYVDQGKKTYVDPLMDDYRRLFPATLPEKSTYLALMAEEVDLPEDNYDMVLCLNVLSDVHNPELVLNHVADYLSHDGVFMVSMDLWPTWLAKLHVFCAHFLPSLPGLNRLYSYTRQGFVHSLSRHFELTAAYKLKTGLRSLSLRQEWMFVCQRKQKGD
ncbi:MAG: methyltransferase domain-containing protein [Mariprofundaceae bacterium]|nr:methyltransferase domain-containing protein [Mariprofundaceae bacterium]